MSRGDTLPVAAFDALSDARAQLNVAIARALVRVSRSARSEAEARELREALRTALDAVRAVGAAIAMRSEHHRIGPMALDIVLTAAGLIEGLPENIEDWPNDRVDVREAVERRDKGLGHK